MHPGCTLDQVYLYRDPIDFRKAIDGLSVLVEQELGLSPFASAQNLRKLAKLRPHCANSEAAA